jgi:hypothetical protein
MSVRKIRKENDKRSEVSIFKKDSKHFVPTVVITILVLFSFSLVLHHSSDPGSTFEAKFTDLSPRGIEIVPASGASDPCPYLLNSTQDRGGFILVPSTNNSTVNDALVAFCVNDSGQSIYFIPLRTHSELQSFYNAGTSPKGLSGVRVF